LGAGKPQGLKWIAIMMLWVRISIRARCTTLCDKVCKWLERGRWFSPGPQMWKNLDYIILAIFSSISSVYFSVFVYYILWIDFFIFVQCNSLALQNLLAEMILFLYGYHNNLNVLLARKPQYMEEIYLQITTRGINHTTTPKDKT
jgi:hypothetical protein